MVEQERFNQETQEQEGRAMGTRVTEARCKEVINITDGLRLGFVSDVEVQLPEGRSWPW